MSEPSWEQQVADWKADLRADISTTKLHILQKVWEEHDTVTEAGLRRYLKECWEMLHDPEASLKEALRVSTR